MFTDSLQALGQRESWAVALGDINGNGSLDAVVGNAGPDEIWINDGQGFFTLLGEVNNGPTRQVFLVDLDGDDVLDLVTAGNTRARVWRNDGQGQLREIRSRIRYSANDAVGVGDMDGDGLPDIVVADVRGCQVWFNQGDGRFQTRRDARCGR
ncbi:MAG: VCBS repeat-containing protein [Chloroflexia bacterium]|nr:VCBS repeat-containing protein [Chloroflexia bacterium]